MRTHLLLATAVLALSSSPALAGKVRTPAAPAAPSPPASSVAAPASAPRVVYGAHGLDLSARDMAVKPGDDFQRYANGKWFDAETIPADRPSSDSFYDVFEGTQDNLRQLITTADPASQYGTLYSAFQNEAAVEAAGDAPLRADLATLDAVKSKSDLARYMGSTFGSFGMSLADPQIVPDTADPTVNGLWLGQSGIGLPEREYYLTAQFKPQRDAYQAYMERTFRSLGKPDPAGSAAKVMAFETALAQKSWVIADRRDVGKINNPMSSAALATYAPGFDWSAYLTGLGVPAQQRIIVNENTAIRDLAAIYGSTPLDTLKLWQVFHIADQASPYLSKAWVDNRFAFTKTLSGVAEQRPRWKRGVALVDGSLGELVGQAYVQRYFPASAKARMDELVGNLKAAMGDRIRDNDWMAPATKTAALEKLSRMTVMVAYPDKFRDYSALRITGDDLYGDVRRARAFNWAYLLADLGKPVDAKKWAMNPQTVNAYNGFNENKIVFPAGILQAPFFDPAADDAVNYGAIGVVIGHEISHGFDDQGRKVDATGAVRDWWTTEDGTRFDSKAKAFGEQYAKFEAAPGAFLNPGLTMGENIADYAGLEVAYDAYHKSLGGKPAPVIDGLTGDQRFFLAYAQVWREKTREDSMRQQVASDPHSPGRFRTLGPIRNFDPWYAAFGVKPGDAMYIAPAQRVRIW